MFGAYATEIRYAALSLDDVGLISYGNCAMSLADITMQKSATVLEENSYDFVRKHRLIPGDQVPLGYRALWQRRNRLAIAKLAAKLSTINQSFAKLLLSSDGNRQNDQFMEIHIYGKFDHQSVTAVSVPGQKNVKDRLEIEYINRIKDYAKKLNLSCTEYD